MKYMKMFPIMYRVIELIHLLFLIGLISSPFIWIWEGWSLGWRVGLSTLIGVIICNLIYKTKKKINYE